MMQWIADNLEWMYWTPPSAITFSLLFLTLVGMTIWDHYAPSVPRKGFLPIPTTRGDRLFLAIIAAIGIHLLWLGLVGAAHVWVAGLIAIASAATLGRWG